MSRVLVTGGSGLIGAYAMKRLAEKGHQVVNYDLVQPSAERAFVLGDLNDNIPLERAGIEAEETERDVRVVSLRIGERFDYP